MKFVEVMQRIGLLFTSDAAVDYYGPFSKLVAAGPLKLLIMLIMIILIIGIIYAYIRIKELDEEHNKNIDEYFREVSAKKTEMGGSSRWVHVTDMFRSTNPNDWRVGLIEADAMLEDLINQMGYRGETMGEKMKKIDRSDMPTIDLAWKAHKMRNRIAHEGSRYQLSPQEAWRAYKMYETIFKTTRFI